MEQATTGPNGAAFAAYKRGVELGQQGDLPGAERA
jgi:hypothetical protein